MSWDIVLFNSRQKINSVEELDDTQLEPTDFCSALESHFTEIVKDDNHREIKGKDFSIDYFVDEDKVSNKMVSLYGRMDYLNWEKLRRHITGKYSIRAMGR